MGNAVIEIVSQTASSEPAFKRSMGTKMEASIDAIERGLTGKDGHQGIIFKSKGPDSKVDLRTSSMANVQEEGEDEDGSESSEITPIGKGRYASKKEHWNMITSPFNENYQEKPGNHLGTGDKSNKEKSGLYTDDSMMQEYGESDLISDISSELLS